MQNVHQLIITYKIVIHILNFDSRKCTQSEYFYFYFNSNLFVAFFLPWISLVKFSTTKYFEVIIAITRTQYLQLKNMFVDYSVLPKIVEVHNLEKCFLH